MKAIVKAKREPGIEVRDVPVPEVRDTDILVKVLAGSLCGSDVHVYEWTPNYEFLPLPVTLGHEFAGEVVQVGPRVPTVAVGERIVALPGLPCGRCPSCQIGLGEACTDRRILGLTTDGAFADYVRLTGATRIFKIPANVSAEAAAVTEPLSLAVHTVDIAGIKPGEKAAVLGPGPVGLLTLQVLKVAGASPVIVTGTSTSEKRLAIAKTLGADLVVNVDQDDPVAVIQEATTAGPGAGLDFVFEASGNPRCVSQALSMVKPGGKVILMGIYLGPAQFNPTELVRSRKSIIGSYAYEPETWHRSLALLASGKIRVEPMITHRVPLTEAKEGFELAVSRQAAKVLFIPAT